MAKGKPMRMVRWIGIICWFLALFVLIQNAQQEKKEEKRQTIEESMEQEPTDSTVIFPTEK